MICQKRAFIYLFSFYFSLFKEKNIWHVKMKPFLELLKCHIKTGMILSGFKPNFHSICLCLEAIFFKLALSFFYCHVSKNLPLYGNITGIISLVIRSQK